MEKVRRTSQKTDLDSDPPFLLWDMVLELSPGPFVYNALFHCDS